MNSVFQELQGLRDGKPIHVTEAFSNRYTIVCHESDRTKTAYCFGVPIRNVRTRDVVDLRFHHYKNESTFIGSEAKIVVTDRVRLINQYGQCDVILEGRLSKKTESAVYFTDDCFRTEICPTLNGVMVVVACEAQARPKLLLRLDRFFQSTRANDNCFSVMREEFVPFVTVSCVGVLNDKGKIIAPCEIQHENIGDLEYALTLFSKCKSKFRIAVEINLQETKLFQDTTVESRHPKRNNAFGGMAFLGESIHFGEQWLYSRLETANHIPQLQSKKILQTILHIPQLGLSSKALTVNRISKRFCSFGSNWQNKIAVTDSVAESRLSNGYYHLDFTKPFGNLKKRSENYVIRTTQTGRPVIIPTGDSFYAPQILEVKFQ